MFVLVVVGKNEEIALDRVTPLVFIYVYLSGSFFASQLQIVGHDKTVKICVVQAWHILLQAQRALDQPCGWRSS